MPRLTRSQSQAQTRQRVLEAATVVFARRGFNGASIEEVADDAGYTKGAVYSNFGSKDDLFLAVLEARLQSQVEAFSHLAEQARAHPEQDFASLLPRIGDASEVWCLLELEFWLYALRHPPVRRRMAALYGQYRTQLAPLVDPDPGADLRPAEVVAAAIALYHGLTLQWHSDPGAIQPDLVSRVLRAMCRRAPSGDGRRSSGRGGGKARRAR